jgi:NDP-sugar pyrophosphorylase family protein
LKPVNDDVLVILLAGGLGTRIRHVAPHLPKPMISVAGRPFIEWSVRAFAAQGFRRFLISAGYKAEIIAAHFADVPVPGVEVRCIAEPERMGTGGGLRYAVSVACPSEPIWIVANGDSLVLADLGTCLDDFRGATALAGLLGVPMADASQFGTLETDERGHLRDFREKQPGSGTINAGVYVLSSRLLESFPDRQPLSMETDVFPHLLRWPQKAPFVDMGTERGLAEAEAFIRSHQEWFS